MRMRSRRLDVQISIMTSVIIIATSISVYFIQYFYSYENMLFTLYERVNAIYDHIDQVLDKEICYTMRTGDDVRTPEFIEGHSMMQRVRNTTGVRYLYIAAKDENGNFIYLLDSIGMLNEEFHPPGSPLDLDIFSDVARVWEGEAVLADQIHTTKMGKLFTSYFPLMEEDEVIGILLIAVDAEHQFNTYKRLRNSIPCIIGIICIISFSITSVLFRRISNPHYQDYANTDQLTGLKNRNSFDVDLQNMMATNTYAKVGILVADLNNLKVINDTMGHQMGDAYLKAVGQALKQPAGKREVVYRVGGDEFIVIFHGTPEAYIQKYIEQVSAILAKTRLDDKMPVSVAMGFAICSQQDDDLYDVYKRADGAMYADKKMKKMKILF